MALSSRLWTWGQEGKRPHSAGKCTCCDSLLHPCQRDYILPGIYHLPIKSAQCSQARPQQGKSQCWSIPKSLLAAAGVFVTDDGYFKQFCDCVFHQGAARAQFLPASPSSTPEPCSHPLRRGATPRVPLTHRTWGTCSHPSVCHSSPP